MVCVSLEERENVVSNRRVDGVRTVMYFRAMKWAGFSLFVLSVSAHAEVTRTVQVPISKTGEVQVAEIISRLARPAALRSIGPWRI